jgi:hypothetical protein
VLLSQQLAGLASPAIHCSSAQGALEEVAAAVAAAAVAAATQPQWRGVVTPLTFVEVVEIQQSFHPCRAWSHAMTVLSKLW